MKVLHVIETLGRGGAEQLLVTLLPALHRQGATAEIVVLRPPYDLQPDLEAHGIRVHRLKDHGKWALWTGARALARLVQQLDVQIVHAHLYFPAVTTAFMRFAGMSSASTFVTFHNLAYAGANKAGIALAVKKRLASFLYKRGMDGMLGVSEAVSMHYQKALGLNRVAVLHNPVVLPKLEVQPVKALPPYRVVVPGRLVHEKGHLDLITALGMLETPVQVVFCGGGPQQQELAKRAPQVQITGAVSHAQMMTEISIADLVVVPSRFEGFGLTALEAMALSRPVVATTAGGLPEVLGQAGVLVPPADPCALAQAIMDLLADPNKRDVLARAARVRAETNFAPDRIALRLLTFYDAALQKDHK